MPKFVESQTSCGPTSKRLPTPERARLTIGMENSPDNVAASVCHRLLNLLNQLKTQDWDHRAALGEYQRTWGEIVQPDTPLIVDLCDLANPSKSGATKNKICLLSAHGVVPTANSLGHTARSPKDLFKTGSRVGLPIDNP